MDGIPSKAIIDNLKKRYPRGARVELIEMNDHYSKLHVGSTGTVSFIDDIGTIHVNWDCGSSLGVIYGIDRVRIV